MVGQVVAETATIIDSETADRRARRPLLRLQEAAYFFGYPTDWARMIF